MFNQKRKIGIEMEGYIEGTYPDDASIPFCHIGMDASLSNHEWNENDEPYGVEIRTIPLEEAIDTIPTIFDKMKRYDWDVDSKAGTHIHVDISDFSHKEVAKLLRFGKGIERIIFSLVEDYRYDNGYCEKIHEGWRKAFWSKSEFNKRADWDAINSYELGLIDFIDNNYRALDGIWNGKYQWMNVLGTVYPTVEFRLFHAVKSDKQLIQQVKLAHNIVEFVKNTSTEQIEFVIKSLYNSQTADEVLTKFFEVIDLEPMNAIGTKAYDKMVSKIEKRNAKKQKQELAV